MRYAPPGFCLNDFDIRKLDDESYHLIHLQGPPIEPRRYNATYLESSYGHAISKDLIAWNTQTPVFGISSPGHFDDSGIWTMRIVDLRNNKLAASDVKNKLWMFYTGLSHQNYFHQQIGVAHSTKFDGTGWCRQTEPIVSVNPQYYQSHGDEPYGMAWRDPFVRFDEEHQRWLMYIAAKTKRGDRRRRGCIAMAVSEDFFHWRVQEPILAPGRYREMECPVIYRKQDDWYLFVSNFDDIRVRAYRAPSPVGPFKELGMLTRPYNYAPRIIEVADDEPVLLHTVWRKWQHQDSGEIMRGMLAQPKRLLFDDDGVPYLGWFSKNEAYFPETDGTEHCEHQNALLNISCLPPNYRRISVRLRLNHGNVEQTGIEVVLEKDFLGIKYLEDSGYIGSEPIENQEPFQTMKVLMFGEFFEVYCDDKLLLSELAYRHPCGCCEVRADGKPLDFCLKIHSPGPDAEVGDGLNVL